MGLGDARDHFVPQQIRRVAPAPQGIPTLDHDSQVLDVGDHFVLLIVGVDFVLHQRRSGGHLGQKFLQFLYIPVRQADRVNLTFLHKPLQGLIRFHIIPVGMMQEHQIHIVQVQPVQTRLDGLLRVLHLATWIDFCCDENIFPFEALLRHGRPNGLAYFFLVAVGGGGVN